MCLKHEGQLAPVAMQASHTGLIPVKKKKNLHQVASLTREEYWRWAGCWREEIRHTDWTHLPTVGVKTRRVGWAK